MTSDIKLTDDSVVLEGSVGINTDKPADALHVVGGVHSEGPSAGFALEDRSFNPGEIVIDARDGSGRRWVVYADRRRLRFYNDEGSGGGKDLADLSGDGTLGCAHLVVGAQQRAREVDVAGGVHVRGGGAGYSFGDRQVADHIDQPQSGERWEWYADRGHARLWSGNDKLTVSAQGDLSVDGTVDGAKVTARTPDGWADGSPPGSSGGGAGPIAIDPRKEHKIGKIDGGGIVVGRPIVRELDLQIDLAEELHALRKRVAELETALAALQPPG